MIYRRNRFKFFLCVLLVFGLCGCGKNENNNVKRNEQIVVCSKNDYTYGKKQMDEVEGIPVVKETGSGFDENALKELLTGKSPYDVIEVDTRNPYAYQYLKQHAYVDLGVSEKLVNAVEQMHASLREGSYYENELWGIPIEVIGNGVCYGEALEKYGVSPKDIVTWDDLLSFSERKLENQDFIGANKQFLINGLFYQYYFEYNDPYNGVVNFQTDYFKKSLEFMKRINQSEKFYEAGSSVTANITWNTMDERKLFVAGSGDITRAKEKVYGFPQIETDNKLRPLIQVKYFIVNPYGNVEGAIKYLEKLLEQDFYKTKRDLFFYEKEENVNEYLNDARVYFEDGFLNEIMALITQSNKSVISIIDASSKIQKKYEDFWKRREEQASRLRKIKSKQNSVEELQKKNRIVIGVIVEDVTLKKAVINYNKKSNKYEAVVKVYAKGDIIENVEASEIILRNAIISSNPPDLIGMDIGVSTKAYMEAGMLEDLYAYLEKSDKLEVSDFRKSILELFTYNGKLATIPPVVTISTMLGKSEVVGNKQGWKVEDVVKLANRYPDARLLADADKTDILNLCLALQVERFWNEDKKECYFRDADFLKTLELCNKYPLEKEKNTQKKLEEFRDENVLLSELDLYSLGYYKRYLEQIGKSDINLIGYPTESGEPGSILCPMGMYGIVSSSQNKKGAWDFLEKFLAGELDDEITAENVFSVYGWGLPVEMKRWEQMIENAKAGIYDNYYESEPLTEKEAMQINYLLDHTSMIAEKEGAIIDVVIEEIEAYFNGKKSAEDTVAIIENRVNLLLQE